MNIIETFVKYIHTGGMQLGLGDFIFYGILIAQTSESELSVTLACMLAIVGVSGCTVYSTVYFMINIHVINMYN